MVEEVTVKYDLDDLISVLDTFAFIAGVSVCLVAGGGAFMCWVLTGAFDAVAVRLQVLWVLPLLLAGASYLLRRML